MDWTTDDGDALFRPPRDRHEAEQPALGPDASPQAMQRLRLPFDADPADVLEQQHTVFFDEDEYRS
jgi:hypothetical protein